MVLTTKPSPSQLLPNRHQLEVARGEAMTRKTLFVLTALNLGLVLTSLALQLRPAFADETPTTLRGRALEIVDSEGRVRASLQLMPASVSKDGTPYAETVLFRLITERGRPSVKLGASEQESGASFAGPTGTKDTYVVINAGSNESALKLRSETGRELILKP